MNGRSITIAQMKDIAMRLANVPESRGAAFVDPFRKRVCVYVAGHLVLNMTRSELLLRVRLLGGQP